MVFSSLAFVFVFIPIFYLIYYLVSYKYKNIVLFLGSILFYCVGVLDQPSYLILFLLSIAINYVLGRKIEQRSEKKMLLIIGLIYNFFWLILFKYAAFFLSGVNAILGSVLPKFQFHISAYQFILPLGISFYTFQSVSYLIDVYRGDCKAEESFFTFGAYISMFPQLIAGPVVTYTSMREQLHKKREFSLTACSNGIKIFIFGLGLKVLLANQVGNLWSSITAIGFESISTPLAWLGIIAYSFQIYFDFYGYSLMAIGLGKMLQLDLPDNFDHPYVAVSMTEFFRRWHITLGQWFRDYVYIPLGGNRTSKPRMIFNLFVVWAFTGLWHGAALNFILWGVILFVIIMIEKLGLKKVLDNHRIFGHIYMMILIPLTWIVFAITDFSQMGVYFSKLFPILKSNQAVVYANDFTKYLHEFRYVLIAGFVFSTHLPEKIWNLIKANLLKVEGLRTNLITSISYLIVFWGAIYCLFIGMNDPFLYFRF